MLRLVENLSAPVKGIIGPWSHHYPDRKFAPGPAIGFLQETLRWWDQWLRGDDTGIMAERDLGAWITESEPPATYVPERSGRWVGVNWPSGPAGQSFSRVLGTQSAQVNSPWNTGQDSGRYFPFGNYTDLPPDQRAEDGRSWYVDFPVEEEPIELLGRGTVQLRLSSTTPRANVIVRLRDVAPDGTSALVTVGVLNLLRRKGIDLSQDMEPCVHENVTVCLRAAGYQFPPRHRIRIAVSNHFWPWVWPHENAGELTIDLAHNSVELPLVAADAHPVSFEEPENATPTHIEMPSGRRYLSVNG